MEARAKGTAEPTPNEAELVRMVRNIRIALIFRDRTPGELGDHMEWSETQRSRRLNGRRGLPVAELRKVAGYLKVSLDDLFLPEDKFVAVISRGMKREELLRKLAQSACLRVVDPVYGQLELAVQEPPELSSVG